MEVGAALEGVGHAQQPALFEGGAEQLEPDGHVVGEAARQGQVPTTIEPGFSKTTSLAILKGTTLSGGLRCTSSFWVISLRASCSFITLP